MSVAVLIDAIAAALGCLRVDIRVMVIAVRRTAEPVAVGIDGQRRAQHHQRRAVFGRGDRLLQGHRPQH